MKKFAKKLALALMLLSAVVLPVTACSGNGNDKPNDGNNATVPSEAGFELPYYNGMSEDGLYDANSFYLNELRTYGADPGALYCSDDDIRDTYAKVKRMEMGMNPGLTEDEFDEEYGTEDEWVDDYGNTFYMVVTGGTDAISSDIKTKYNATHGAYTLYRSKNLTDWEIAGRVGGFAIPIHSYDWLSGNSPWAPELIRDPKSGRYFLFASAQTKNGNDSKDYYPHFGTYYNMLQGLIAMADNPLGPYEVVSADSYYATLVDYDANGNPVINADGEALDPDGNVVTTVNENGEFLDRNGYRITSDTPAMLFGKHCESLKKLYPNPTGHSTAMWAAIDFNPVRMDNGDMYVYFSQHVTDLSAGNHIWGVKMKDMITPDYDTLTFIATPNVATITKTTEGPSADMSAYEIKQKYITFGVNTDGSEMLGADGKPITEFNGYYYLRGEKTELTEGTINEGTEVIQHGDKYYLTFSPYGYGSRSYAVRQAVGDNPLGPFTKLGKDYNPVMGINSTNDYMAGTGHHCFIKAGDELFALYHAFYNPVNNEPNGSFLGRAIGADRVQFMHNDTLGYDILYGNGPTYSLQPLPDVATGKTSVARKATIVTDGDKDTEKYLNDGLFTVQDFTLPWEYNATNAEQKGTTITLKWDKPVTISSFIVYNSQSYFYAFDKVDSVVFKLAEKPSWYGDREYNGYCYMKDVACDPDHVDNDNWFMRQGGGALASFNEITVTEMTIRISSKYTTMSEDLFDEDNYAIHVSEIYVTGKEA